MADSIVDDQFGEIIVRRHPRSTKISVRISPQNTIIVTAPRRTLRSTIRRAVRSMRNDIEQMLSEHAHSMTYSDDQPIGKSWHLIVIATNDDDLTIRRDTKTRRLTIMLPSKLTVSVPSVQRAISQEVQKILRKEARVYLPSRLSTLALRHGFRFKKTRLTHASTRWGSCSSSGTISMNIALMKLPLDIIDYVLIHELCHTIQMNHSPAFWKLVEAADPDFKRHRAYLRSTSPRI